jgi:RimJ/RimL family protein N-acetyltransferase
VRARAILLDDDGRAILFRRVRPGREPYWAAPGGRVERSDRSLEAALRRELREELNAEIELLDLAWRNDDEAFFRCRLVRRLPGRPTAAEFGDPAKGSYEEQAIPLVARSLSALNILPPRLKEYLGERARAPYPSDGGVELGRFGPDDVHAIVAADLDGEHARWFDAPPGWMLPRERAAADTAPWPEEWRRQRRLRFAVRSPPGGTLVGGCEVHRRGDGRASLAYWTFADHRGRGHATRAVWLATRFCFEELFVRRVQILVDAENVASRAVALAAGFSEEGTLRAHGLLAGERRDMVLFSRLDSDP